LYKKHQFVSITVLQALLWEKLSIWSYCN